MSYRIQEEILRDYKQSEEQIDGVIADYMDQYANYLKNLSLNYLFKEVKSGYNRMNRHQLWSSEEMNVKVRPGDVCFLDFGQAYKNESGFQHFGLVLSTCNHKVLVVPMTSKLSAERQSRNRVPNGKKHLYYIGLLDGLNKHSTLFLNDFKYLNSSRIISVNGHLSPDSPMFREIHAIIRTEML